MQYLSTESETSEIIIIIKQYVITVNYFSRCLLDLHVINLEVILESNRKVLKTILALHHPLHDLQRQTHC